MTRQLQGCGTPAGYRRHLRRNEPRCQPCRRAHAKAITEHRRKPWTPRQLKPCGTEAAYQRHIRRGERTCFKCRRAHAAEIARYQARQAA
jgi:hypothetical protein